MTTRQKHVNYLTNWLYNAYQVKLGRRSADYFDVKSTYPLHDIVSKETIQDSDIDAVLEHLNSKLSNDSLEDKARYWIRVGNTLAQDNFRTLKENRNALRILAMLLNEYNYTDFNFWNVELTSVFKLLYKRASLSVENQESTQELRNELFDEAMCLLDKTIKAVKLWWVQKLYKRWDRYGNIVETENKDWTMFSYHGLDCSAGYQNIMRLNVGKIHFGCELEVDFKTQENYNDFMDFCLEKNYLENNGIKVERDGSLTGSFPGEIISAPMVYENATSMWKDICEKLAELNVKVGYENMRGGLHIHFTRDVFNGETQKAITDTIYDLPREQKETIFGRAECSYAKWDKERSYRTLENFVLAENTNGLYKKTIKLTGYDRYTLVNHCGEKTIEVRGFNSCLQVADKITWLNDLINRVINA